jgi:hypothetical protein
MGLVSQEDLEKWIKKQIAKGNWLQVNDMGSPQGRQLTYMTFAGQFVVVQYDIKGKVMMVGQPIAMPQPMPQNPGFLGKRFPGIGGIGQG